MKKLSIILAFVIALLAVSSCITPIPDEKEMLQIASSVPAPIEYSKVFNFGENAYKPYVLETSDGKTVIVWVVCDKLAGDNHFYQSGVSFFLSSNITGQIKNWTLDELQEQKDNLYWRYGVE